MKQILMFVLLIVGWLYLTFQPILYYNHDTVNETIDLAMNEALKEAAVEGRFTDEIYETFFNVVESVHRIDRRYYQIQGTESITTRGHYLTFKVEIPAPIRRFEDILSVNRVQEYYTYEKVIMSEWVAS